MNEYILKTGSKSFSAGEAFVLKENAQNTNTEITDIDGEINAFNSAADKLMAELKAASSNAGSSADIFETELMFLEDDSFCSKILEAIRNDHISAASAVQKAGEELSKDIESAESEYLRGRGEDVRGMVKRLISIIEGGENTVPQKPVILVASELSPAQLSAVPSEYILGVITARGSSTSHVSILAENLEVPYIFGSEEAIRRINEGDRLIISGEKLMIDPADADYEAAVKRAGEEREKRASLKAGSDVIKTRTRIYANISGPKERDALAASGAEGVGLFRSEFIFLGDRAPTEEEQFAAYRTIAEVMGEKETIIRTMDLGSDKTPSWLDLPKEKNPALGLRGIRVSLENRDLFKTQLRALLRAAVFGNIKIMLPMITSLREVDESKKLLETCSSELRGEGTDHKIPLLGVMIETPAAVMIADELAEAVSFFSIGTNDLTQYSLALDREGQGLEDYYDPCHPGLLRLIKKTADAAHKNNIPVAVCGELAGNPAAIRALIEAGIDELSVSIPKINDVRELAARTEKELNEPAPALESIGGPISAPADGYLVPMEDIEDEAFSKGTMGQCFGIMPDNGKIYAPCDGVISAITETKHAITIERSTGSDVLVHVGIDTVKLSGEGFRLHIKEGDAVKCGDLIMEADIDLIRRKGYSPLIVIVLL